MTSNHGFLSRDIFRSKSLPRNLEALKKSELDAIDIDVNLLVRMQRWILCLVIGMMITWRRYFHLDILTVDFDLVIGPAVHGTFPAAILSESESANV